MVIRSFAYSGMSTRIVFGAGRISELNAIVEELGRKRALVLSTPQQEQDARRLFERLPQAVAVFSRAAMHTPLDVTQSATDLALELKADCLVSFGGGSTIGLGKAIALRTDLLQIAVPTTYAGSEVTPILGQTEDGTKTTIRDPKVLPEIVIYDPDLTLSLPIAMSVTSGLNAIAHAAEALYARDRNPISTLMAAEGLRALKAALPALVQAPSDSEARSDALYGAWLCGTVLGTVGMALHHKLCHVLGGSFAMPHAETHAVLLPHTVGFNATSVPDLIEPITKLFGDSPGSGLFAFASSVGAPRSLKQLGFREVDIEKAAAAATENPYANPRAFDRTAIADLLRRAWSGDAPDH